MSQGEGGVLRSAFCLCVAEGVKQRDKICPLQLGFEVGQRPPRVPVQRRAQRRYAWPPWNVVPRLRARLIGMPCSTSRTSGNKYLSFPIIVIPFSIPIPGDDTHLSEIALEKYITPSNFKVNDHPSQGPDETVEPFYNLTLNQKQGTYIPSLEIFLLATWAVASTFSSQYFAQLHSLPWRPPPPFGR